jgi:osmotically-inducible protein OsmY
VEKGEVTLEGTVETRRQKRLAEALADTVRGVHNRLRLKKHRRPEEPTPEAETSH